MFRNHAIVGALALLCTILSAGTPTQSVEAAGISAGAQTAPKVPPAAPQITQQINNNVVSPMATNVPSQALVAANDQGAVADSLPLNHMLMQLRRPQEQEQALDQLMKEQTTPGSPNYHNWLIAQQFAQYGLAQSDLNTIASWLQSQGFTVNTVYTSGVMIDFSGTAKQVAQAFKTSIHNLNVKGVAHIANVSVPQIPSALAPAVVGIVSLSDFRPHTNYKKFVKPAFDTNSGNLAIVPADVQTIYNITPLLNATSPITGAGQTIGLFEDTDIYSTIDIDTFRSTFGLGAVNFSQVHPGPSAGANGCTDPGDNGDDTEAEIDVEYAGASAPGATLQLVSCTDTETTFGGLIAMQNIINGPPSASNPTIWSLSYGFCEADNGAAANAAFSSTYQQASAAGISVFVSSGDEGAASCDADQASAIHGIAVSGFTSTPYNVSVGGTDFGDIVNSIVNAPPAPVYFGPNGPTFGSALSYIDEIPWNDSCASQLLLPVVGFATNFGADGFCNDPIQGEEFLTTGSGSGGPSGCFTGSPSVDSPVVSGTCAGGPKPWWQAGLFGNPNDGVRDIPDVSLFASNGFWGHYYPVCYSNQGAQCAAGDPGDWVGFGGTSISTPIMAGIQALVNQKIGSSVGNPNPIYYQLAAAEYGNTGSTTCNSTLGNTVDPSCVFYDLTQGDMDVNCGPDTDLANAPLYNCYLPSGTNGVLSTSNLSYQPAYATTAGWDFPSGIGSVNAANLVNNWPVPSAATQLAFTVEPGASYGSNLPISVVVTVEDSSGHVVPGDTSAITLALSGGTAGAVLNGTKTLNAASGVATFTGLSVNSLGTNYVLTATDGTFPAVGSSAFNITAAAATVTFSQQPTSTMAGANIAPALVVHVADAGANPVAGDPITLSIRTNPGGSTLTGGSSVATDASGNATFPGVSLNVVANGYALRARDGSRTPINSANSNLFNITTGPAQSVVFTVQPQFDPNYVAGAPIPFAAQVLDAGGNPVGAGENITLAIENGPLGAALSGSVTAVTDATGTATFGNPIPVSANFAGGYILSATDTTTASAFAAASTPFSIIAAAPAQIVFSTDAMDVLQGSSTSVAVTELDTFGNVTIPDSGTLVSFTIPSCGGTSLGTVMLNDGVGTLTASQRFYTVATGLQITATTAGTALTAMSSLFDVTANADLIFADGLESCRP